jgi:hypothetical protein
VFSFRCVRPVPCVPNVATPLYLKVSVPYQESERSCIFWLVDIDFVSLFDLAIFSLALFRQCGIFGFSFLLQLCITSLGTLHLAYNGRRFSADLGRICSHKSVDCVAFYYNFRLRLFIQKYRAVGTMPSWKLQDQIERQNQYRLTKKYMTFPLPGMVQTLQDKVAWLTLF